MKRKPLKIAALIAALALILGLIWMGESLVGNPISRNVVRNAAEKRLEEVYADTDFVLESVGYSFKDGGYTAHISSPTSGDTTFSFLYDHWGKFLWDGYEGLVLSGENTARRLDLEYRALVKQVLHQLNAYDADGIQYGTLDFFDEKYPDGLREADLELDRVYDVGELGARCGTIVFYADTDEATPAHAAQLALEIRRACDQAGVGFRGLELVLRDGEDFHTELGYEEIVEEGLEERILDAHNRQEQIYAELDRQKNSELE